MPGRCRHSLAETSDIRKSEWGVALAPPHLLDRRVEITGPTDRKMMINALNSGANAFMADFEDSNSPTWENVVSGQANLIDAIEGTIAFASDDGKRYRLNERTATLFVRPRGWAKALSSTPVSIRTRSPIFIAGPPQPCQCRDISAAWEHPPP